MNDAENDIALSMVGVVEWLGVYGVVTVLMLGVLLCKSKTARRLMGRACAKLAKKIIRYVQISMWATKMGVSIRLAHRLQPKRWVEMCEDRKLVGLKRGKVKRTKQGVAVHVTFNKTMTLEYVTSKVTALETGLGVKPGAIRIERGGAAHRGIVQVMTRDPLAKGVPWEVPVDKVSVRTPLGVAMTAFGEWLELNLCQRILVIGGSGSGKSSLQRILAGYIALAVDADLEMWDLKYGTEAQHYESAAVDTVTDPEGCAKRIEWYRDVELPRRAEEMKRLKVSEWPISRTHPARFLMVDEGSDLIRNLSPTDLKSLFKIMEQGRALGVFIIWATQFPKSTNLPTELRSQFSAIIALLMKRASESRIVFEDDTREGWTPHTLRGKGWCLVQDEDNTDPLPGRVPWIHPDPFREIKATPTAPPQVPVISLHKEAVPVAVPEGSNYDKALQVFRLAGEHGAPVAAVRQATELENSQAYTIVNQLIKNGEVVKLKQGRYAHTQYVLEGASS